MEYHKGDLVERVSRDNGSRGARIGQVAEVVRESDDYVHVTYAGMHPDMGGEEDWLKHNTKLLNPIKPAEFTRIPSPLPEDSNERKTYPLYSGLLKYFPAALAAVAHHSYRGNQKHNPGLPMQHARDKSGDHEDALMRHLMEGDYEGVAWRALALLQEKLEAEGAPVAPAATFNGSK